MEITKELQELAKFSSDVFPVVSVYLNVGTHHGQQQQSTAFLEQHLRQARALTLDAAAARESLDHDLERVAQWGQACLHHTAGGTAMGCAVFACSGAGVWVELPSPLPFDNEWTIADHPALRQLARLDTHATSALVVFIYPQTARVFEIVLGGFVAETGFASDVPLPHMHSGWGQMRYRHQVKEDAEHHYRGVAAYVADYLRERPDTVLMVSGADESVSTFQEFLPLSVQPQLFDAAPLGLHASRDRILQLAQALCERHEREEERISVQLLLNTAGRGGLAVLGLPDTLTAINAGVVHTLVMHENFRRHGWRCGDCDAIGDGMLASCPVCSGTVSAVEVGEAMVTEVLRHDGFVETIAPEARLQAHDGVGAFLRHKAIGRVIEE